MTNWEETGLLIGLSGERKDDCIRAFDQAYYYLTTKEKIDFDIENDLVLKQNHYTMNDLKQFFIVKRYGEIDIELILFPIIRRIVDRGKSVNFYRLVNHIQKTLKHYEFIHSSPSLDIEAELCEKIANTY